MEKKLFRDILLPLEEISFRRMVASLWVDTLNSNWSLRRNFDLVGDMVKDKILRMLPASLKKPVIPVVRLIGSEILNWQTFHQNNFPTDNDNLSYTALKLLHWTSRGTIDYQKTAKKLIDLKIIDDTKRYELACLYCLEDDIPLLWEEVTEEYKKLLKEEFDFSADMQLRYYWAYVLTGEEYKFRSNFRGRVLGLFRSFEQQIFFIVLMKGNKAAARFFFQKFSNKDGAVYLSAIICCLIDERYEFSPGINFSDFPKQNLSELLYYFLSLMSPEQQMRSFQSWPLEIFACSLDWSLNDLCLELAVVMWTFLSKIAYDMLQYYIFRIINHAGYCNPILFQEFFLQSPCNFRKGFVGRVMTDYRDYFLDFFKIQDSETIEVIFRNIDAADRARLIFSKRLFELLLDYILVGKWHIVEVCIREAMLSKKGKKRLRRNLFKFMEKKLKRLGVEERTRKQKRFCEFFDNTYTSAAGEENPKDE